MSWNPEEFLQTYKENGFLGVIHKILAINLSISPYEDTTKLEDLLEFCMTSYAELTEAGIKQRIKARVKSKLETAVSEAPKQAAQQESDVLRQEPPQVTQLESDVLGQDPPQVAQLELDILGQDPLKAAQLESDVVGQNPPQVTQLHSDLFGQDPQQVAQHESDILEQDPPQEDQLELDVLGKGSQQAPQLESDVLEKDSPPVPQMKSDLKADHPQSLPRESEVHVPGKASPQVPKLQSGKDSPKSSELESDVFGEYPPQSPPDLDVFGRDSLQEPQDTDLITQVSKQAKALPHIPKSLSESQIKSSCYNQSTRRRRNNRRQRVRQNQSSPNCAGFIKDEDCALPLQDHTPEVSEPEGTSEAGPATGGLKELQENCEAMHCIELLRVFRMTNQRVPHMMTDQGLPVYLSNLLEESENTEDLPIPGSVEEQMIRPGTQSDMAEEMIFNNGLVNSSHSESHHQLNEREILVISHHMTPEPTMAMVENSSHLPLEPKSDLGCGHNGEARTPSPSFSPVISTYDIHEDEWSFVSNTFVTDTFDMDELVEPNMEITSCRYEQGEGRLAATKGQVEEDVKPLLQGLHQVNELEQSPSFDKSSDRYFKDLLQAIAENSSETSVESSLSCETSFIPIDDHIKNYEQLKPDICLSSSEILKPQKSGQIPTLSKSSSQSTETNRTYVIDDSQDNSYDRPHILSSISLSDLPESIHPLETRQVEPLLSTSPGFKQLDSTSEEKLSSHDFSNAEVQSVPDRDELSSSHSLTSVVSDATVQLSDSEHEERNEQLKSPFHAWKKRFSLLCDFALNSPDSTGHTTEKLPRIHSAPPSLSRLEPTKVSQIPTLPPIFESVVFRGTSTPPVFKKGIATNKSQSLPSLNTTARETSLTMPCTFKTHILQISPIKIRTHEKRAQRPNSSTSTNDKDRNMVQDSRVVGKPPPSPSPSKTPRRSNSQTGSRTNLSYLKI